MISCMLSSVVTTTPLSPTFTPLHSFPVTRMSAFKGRVRDCEAGRLAGLGESGSLLVFLPGAGEIDRLAEWLRERLAA